MTEKYARAHVCELVKLVNEIRVTITDGEIQRKIDKVLCAMGKQCEHEAAACRMREALNRLLDGGADCDDDCTANSCPWMQASNALAASGPCVHEVEAKRVTERLAEGRAEIFQDVAAHYRGRMTNLEFETWLKRAAEGREG